MDEKEKEELLKKIEEYTKKIEKEPNNASNYYNRGFTYFLLKKYEEAIKDYDKAIELNPNNASYYYNRGVNYGELEKYQEAIKDCDKAIELNPNNASYYFVRGYAYGELEKYQEAIKDYDKAIELNPNNASYYYNRGVNYGELEKYQEAIKDCDKAIELNPNNASYYFVRGYAYGELEKYQEAIKDYDKAIELNPNYKSAIENKEFSLKKLKNFSQTNEISEPKYQIIFNKAKALHLQGEIDDNFKKAEKEFSSFIKKYKDSPNKSPELENLLTEATSYLIASKFKVKRFIGYLTFADILGWKGIWQKQNTPNGKINYAECLFSIKNSLKNKFNNEQNFYNINLISDTFVIFSEDFKQSNELSKNLIEQCLEKGLLIRGATSYGECYNKDMVYVGQAVDEAASWHEKGEEIGIFYTSSAKLNIKLNDIELEKYFLINDEVNTKIGKIKTYFINWYNKTTEQNFYEIMKKEIIYPEISLKYFNTENRLNKILHSKKKKGKNNVKNR